jgi:hypothetical protein
MQHGTLDLSETLFQHEWILSFKTTYLLYATETGLIGALDSLYNLILDVLGSNLDRDISYPN